jgi:hypothetical protein
MEWMYKSLASCSALAMFSLLSQQAFAQCQNGCCGGGRQSQQSSPAFTDNNDWYNGGRYAPSAAPRLSSPYGRGPHVPSGNGGCSCGQSHSVQPSPHTVPWSGPSSPAPPWASPPGRYGAPQVMPPQTFGRGPGRYEHGPMGGPFRSRGFQPWSAPAPGRW